MREEIKAKEELEKLLYSGKKIILYDLGGDCPHVARDKYFRLLASVKVGNIDASAGSRLLQSI